jgi:hypothetical protein
MRGFGSRRTGAATALICLAAMAAGAAPAQRPAANTPEATRFSIEAVIQIGDAMIHREVDCDLNTFCTILQQRNLKISTIRSLHDQRLNRLPLNVSTREDCCFLSGGQTRLILETRGRPDRFQADLYRGRASRGLEYPMNEKVGSIFIILKAK